LGDRKGIRLVKVLPQQFPKVYFLGLGVTRSNITWSNSVKMGRLNDKGQNNLEVDGITVNWGF